MKILLAEDDAKMAEYIVTGLTENGHSVDHVIDGREALSYCLYNDCDLAILDRMMPGMDGLSVLKALRAAKKDLPVLFLTALGQVDDRVEGLAAGGDDYLTKPFHFSDNICSRADGLRKAFRRSCIYRASHFSASNTNPSEIS